MNGGIILEEEGMRGMSDHDPLQSYAKASELLGVSCTRVCGTCKSFPIRWPHDAWRCSRGDAAISRETEACGKWEVGPADQAEYRLERLAPILERQAEKARKRERWPFDLLHSHKGVVYVVDCEKYTKIGATGGEALGRLKGLHCDNPFELTIYALAPRTFAVQRSLHMRLATWRHRNEWFRFTSKGRDILDGEIIKLGGVIYDRFRAPTALALLEAGKVV
jgi:hypothetical protein